MSQRIDPAAVLAACRQFPKCKVVTDRFGNGVDCGCPLTLFALYLGMEPRVSHARHFLQGRGYCVWYVEYFVRAIDGLRCALPLTDNSTSGQGYADGTATRELLVREGVLSDR